MWGVPHLPLPPLLTPPHPSPPPPSAVNSNYYALDSSRIFPTTVQAARAAALLHGMGRYLSSLEAEAIPPVMIGDGGVVPLCMWQVERMFATCRVPGRETDTLVHYDAGADIRHVAVICGGSYYKLRLFGKSDGLLIAPDELEAALEGIMLDAAARTAAGAVSEAEAVLPAITAENRTRWAEFRESVFGEGPNARSLAAIESALFVLTLSPVSFPQTDDREQWSARGKRLLVSPGGDTWYDKSVSLHVFADGKAGLNAEHSWADAPIIAHMLETCIVQHESGLAPYRADGHCRSFAAERAAGTVSAGAHSAAGGGGDSLWTRLGWSLTRAAEAELLSARDSLITLGNDTDLCVGPFTEYGKDVVSKTFHVSPDAWVQLAMQLAYYRDQGRFDATYESSMTRLFLHGRTETVRPCTAESVAFVRAMEDAGTPPAAKLACLRAAAAAHVAAYTDAMAGKGIDRHLFALYVVSKGRGIDSPFLSSALSVPWKLSTSQQPQRQTALWDIRTIERGRVSPGGGFGPVDVAGYGVSYMVSSGDQLFFHVSSRVSAPNTSSARFFDNIVTALKDMRRVLGTAVSPAAGGAGGARGE